MDDLLLLWVRAWMDQHPQAAARLLGLGVVLFSVGNLCKILERSLPPERLTPRVKTALRIGATVGNVVWGLVALTRAFFKGQDPDQLSEGPPSGSPPPSPPA